MRTAAFTLVFFVACYSAAKAQRFTILPQVGFENSRTSIQYNEGDQFSPLGVKFSPQASLRLNYASKPGHGFFLGASSSRSVVSFSFTDPETGMNNFSATTGDMQIRLEGGYLFNSKPVYFNKAKSANSKSSTSSAKKSCGTSSFNSSSSCQKSSTASYSRCGSSQSKAKQAVTTKNKGSWLRIQPSLGMAFIPAVQSDMITKTSASQSTYEYRAGNWRTAVTAGAGFEFGNNSNRLFTISINYLKGLGNLDDVTLNTVSGTKSVTTVLSSKTSGWNLRAGIPFSLSKSKQSVQRKSSYKNPACQQYRIQYRCRKTI
ncbi:MAG TPA: hypothetical protein VFX58_01560 [Chitinophagaceae bacterium]|nr:hypothetical protein [Chitinophagaceae bacterium]